MPFESSRAYYRVTYPMAERPRLRLGAELHEVVDCSEQGVRYRVRGIPLPRVGDPVAGLIRFHRGAEAEVAGIVVRLEGEEVAVHLTARGIPFQVLLDEQRWLRAHFPLVG